MMKNIKLLRVLLVIILLFFLLLLFYWFPFNSIDGVTFGVKTKRIPESSKILIISTMIFLYSICTLLFIFIICAFWKITINIEKNTLYSKNNFNIMRIIILVLIINLIIFDVINLIFYELGWSRVSLVYILYSLLGFSIIPFTIFISSNIKTELKKKEGLNDTFKDEEKDLK